MGNSVKSLREVQIDCIYLSFMPLKRIKSCYRVEQPFMNPNSEVEIRSKMTVVTLLSCTTVIIEITHVLANP